MLKYVDRKSLMVISDKTVELQEVQLTTTTIIIIIIIIIIIYSFRVFHISVSCWCSTGV